MLRTALEGLLRQIDALSQDIGNYDRRIGELAKECHPEVKRLTSIPGVGTLTALTFPLTLGRPERFAHSRDVAGFLGLRPKQKQSGTRDPQLGIAKSGDPYLRKLLVQCAHHVLGHWGKDSALRRWGLMKTEGGKESYAAGDCRGGPKAIRPAAPLRAARCRRPPPASLRIADILLMMDEEPSRRSSRDTRHALTWPW